MPEIMSSWEEFQRWIENANWQPTTVQDDVQREFEQEEAKNVISSTQRYATQQMIVMSQLGNQIFGGESL